MNTLLIENRQQIARTLREVAQLSRRIPPFQAMSAPLVKLADRFAQDRRALCICLEHIGDNGPCPVHGRRP